MRTCNVCPKFCKELKIEISKPRRIAGMVMPVLGEKPKPAGDQAAIEDQEALTDDDGDDDMPSAEDDLDDKDDVLGPQAGGQERNLSRHFAVTLRPWFTGRGGLYKRHGARPGRRHQPAQGGATGP